MVFGKKKTDKEKADKLNEQITTLQEQATVATATKKKKIYDQILALNKKLKQMGGNYQGVLRL